MTKPRVLFVGRTRYRLPLEGGLARKWAALSELLDLRIVASGTGADPRFHLLPQRPLDGPVFYASLPWVVAEAEESEALFTGGDFWPYGIEPNRKTIQTLIDYLEQQELLERKVRIEELFAPNTFDMYKT